MQVKRFDIWYRKTARGRRYRRKVRPKKQNITLFKTIIAREVEDIAEKGALYYYVVAVTEGSDGKERFRTIVRKTVLQ